MNHSQLRTSHSLRLSVLSLSVLNDEHGAKERNEQPRKARRRSRVAGHLSSPTSPQASKKEADISGVFLRLDNQVACDA